MTERERLLAYFNYQPVDRPPLHLTGPWGDTLERWYTEGLPRGADPHEFLGLPVAPLRINNVSGATALFPWFEERTLEETDEVRIYTDRYGRTVRDFRRHTTLPEWVDVPVRSPADLERLLAERFDLDRMDERFDSAWEARVRAAADTDAPVLVDGGCYYWTLRSLADVDGASYLFYDAPRLVDELFERINLLCLEGLRRAAALTRVDLLGFGEDLAYKNGPLLSPDMFRRLLLPRYRRVMDLAHELGISLTWYDSDGDLRLFIPDYLEVGINGLAPCEVAAGMDPPELRRRWGRDLRLVGGIDKREIAKGPAAIDRELDRQRWVIEDGGFLPAIDHSIPADVSFANYRYYLERLLSVLGLS